MQWNFLKQSRGVIIKGIPTPNLFSKTIEKAYAQEHFFNKVQRQSAGRKTHKNSQENPCARVSLLIKLQTGALKSKIFKNTFFIEHFQWLLQKVVGLKQRKDSIISIFKGVLWNFGKVIEKKNIFTHITKNTTKIRIFLSRGLVRTTHTRLWCRYPFFIVNFHQIK